MKLTTRQKKKLSEHSAHHSAKHMEFMKRRMRAGDTFRNYTGGLVSGTGTIELQYTQGAASTKEQELINDILDAPSTEAESANAQFKLYLATTGTKGFTFDGIITSASFGTKVGDLTTVSCSFQTCGAITGALDA